jgi:hypothetical protein
MVVLRPALIPSTLLGSVENSGNPFDASRACGVEMRMRCGSDHETPEFSTGAND